MIKKSTQVYTLIRSNVNPSSSQNVSTLDNISDSRYHHSMKLPQELTTVTSTSKILAAVLFVMFPILGFIIGFQYGNSIPRYNSRVNINSVEPSRSMQKNLTVKKWQSFSTASDVLAPVKFSLEFPEEFKVLTLSIEGSHEVVINQTGKILSTDLSINPFIISDYESDDTLNQIMNQYYCHEKNSTCPDEKNAISMQVDGNKAYKLVPYGQINSTTVVVKKGKSIVEISVNLQDRNKSEYSDTELLRIFDHMWSTLHFSI